jgi:hypothetical protein
MGFEPPEQHEQSINQLCPVLLQYYITRHTRRWKFIYLPSNKATNREFKPTAKIPPAEKIPFLIGYYLEQSLSTAVHEYYSTTQNLIKMDRQNLIQFRRQNLIEQHFPQHSTRLLAHNWSVGSWWDGTAQSREITPCLILKGNQEMQQQQHLQIKTCQDSQETEKKGNHIWFLASQCQGSEWLNLLRQTDWLQT